MFAKWNPKYPFAEFIASYNPTEIKSISLQPLETCENSSSWIFHHFFPFFFPFPFSIRINKVQVAVSVWNLLFFARSFALGSCSVCIGYTHGHLKWCLENKIWSIHVVDFRKGVVSVRIWFKVNQLKAQKGRCFQFF